MGTPVSTQKEFTGQQGWNDCLPESMMSDSKPRGSRKPRRAPDDAAAYLNPPSASSSSVSLSNTSNTTLAPSAPPKRPPTDSHAPPPAANRPAVRPTAEADSASKPAETVDANSVLARVVALLDSSKLSSKEVAQYKARFEKIVPELAAVHLRAIETALDAPTSSARDILMKHSMLHSGTATWCTPLRRVIEAQS